MLSTPHELACRDAIAFLSEPRSDVAFQHVDSRARLEELWKIDKQAYQDCSLELDEFAQWWERYEFGSRVLLRNDRIIASIGIYPISPTQASAFSQGRIPECSLIPVSLEECDRAPQQHWYASGIVVAEDNRGESSPLKTLLKMGLTYWMKSGHVAYPVSLMAIAEYEIGARLLSLVGFEKIKDGDGLPDKCDLYQLTVNSESELRALFRSKRLL